MKLRQYIYKNGFEAWSYVIISIITMIIPILLYINSGGIGLYLTMFINTTVVLREYIMLLSEEKMGKTFFKKCIIGLIGIVPTWMYSLGMMMYIAGVDPPIRWLIADSIAVGLLMCPVIIAGIEGAKYINEKRQEISRMESMSSEENYESLVDGKTPII